MGCLALRIFGGIENQSSGANIKDMSSARLKTVNPDAPLTPEARQMIVAMARRQHGAQSLAMKLITTVGTRVENSLGGLPQPVQARLNDAARDALTRSYALAARSHGRGPSSAAAHRVAATVTGALGGAGGLATSLIEMPIAVTTIFRSVQHVAQSHGFDPAADETRLDCLQVFGAGAPDAGDDGIDTAFLGARLAFSGSAVRSVIAKIAPRVAAVLGQKLASQVVPVLGAIAGAGTNYAFVDYYTEIAHVHFGLKALSRDFGDEQVLDAFHEELARLHRPQLRA